MLLTNIDILWNKTKHATTILLVLLITLILPVKILGSFMQNVLRIRNPPMFCSRRDNCFRKIWKITWTPYQFKFQVGYSYREAGARTEKKVELTRVVVFHMKGLDLSLVAPKISLNLPLLKVSVKRVSLPKTKSQRVLVLRKKCKLIIWFFGKYVSDSSGCLVFFSDT